MAELGDATYVEGDFPAFVSSGRRWIDDTCGPTAALIEGYALVQGDRFRFSADISAMKYDGDMLLVSQDVRVIPAGALKSRIDAYEALLMPYLTGYDPSRAKALLMYEKAPAILTIKLRPRSRRRAP